MPTKTTPDGVVVLAGWPPGAAQPEEPPGDSGSGAVRVLAPPPPSSYWHSEALQDDPHFDRGALARSRDFLARYVGNYSNNGEFDYPPHPFLMPHTGLPAGLNGYLPDFARFDSIEPLREWVQRWLEDPDLAHALTGIPPQPLFETTGAGRSSRLERWITLQLRYPDTASQSDALRQRDTLHFHYQQFHAGKWPVYGGRIVAHCGFGDPRCSVSSSYLPVREDVPFEPRLSEVDALAVAQKVFMGYVGDRFRESPIIALVPYAQSAQFITVYRDRICVAYRFEATNEGGDEAWRVFVDAESGLVLGPPERLMAQTKAYYCRNSAAARMQPAPQVSIDPNLTLSQLETALAPYCSGLETADGTSIVLADLPDPQAAPPPADAIEAANIAFHAFGALDHFMTACGVIPAQLRSYHFSYEVWEEVAGMNEKVTKAGTQANPLRLVVGKADGEVLQMGFVSAEEVNPKTIIFQTVAEPTAIEVDGHKVHNPSLDPEVICHELAHAIMWLLNRLPFIENGSSVPFRQALLEGYASYFARSVAARNGNDMQDNPHVVWAGSAYRFEDWDDRWGLAGVGHTGGADALPDPNALPAFALEGVGVYDLGMVWARALWDIRTLMPDHAWGGLSGPDLADRLALEGYLRCHGLITSFLVAANGVIDSAKQKGLGTALIEQMAAAFRARHIVP